MESKKTPLFDEHVKLGAKIIDFHGWQMPVYYTSILEEHHAARNTASLFDTSHMGSFVIEGQDAYVLLQKLIAKDLENLSEKKCFYTVMCNENGGIIDDLFVYKFSNTKFLIVNNSTTTNKLHNHIFKNIRKANAILTNTSDITAKLDLQGPNAKKILQEITDYPLDNLKKFEFENIALNNIQALVSRTGYTGEDGFEIYFKSTESRPLWNAILETGKQYNLKPVGLGARDTLRIECCYSLYGNELNEQISPFEGAIPFTVSLGKEFIGKKALIDIKENYSKIISPFMMIDKSIPRPGYIVTSGGKNIGTVTSGTMSPTLKQGIGLALIQKEYAVPQTKIDINIRGKLYSAKIVKKPFYRGEK